MRRVRIAHVIVIAANAVRGFGRLQLGLCSQRLQRRCTAHCRNGARCACVCRACLHQFHNSARSTPQCCDGAKEGLVQQFRIGWRQGDARPLSIMRLVLYFTVSKAEQIRSSGMPALTDTLLNKWNACSRSGATSSWFPWSTSEGPPRPARQARCTSGRLDQVQLCMQVFQVFQGLRRCENDRTAEPLQQCGASAGPAASAARPVLDSAVVEPARPANINQASDLNVILQERDACGVRACRATVLHFHAAFSQ